MQASEAQARIGAALQSLAAPYVGDPDAAPCAVLADLARLCAPGRRVDAAGDRYRDAGGALVAAVARGDLDLADPRAVDVIVATLEAARRHFADYMPAKRRGATFNEWQALPESMRREIRIRWRGVPTGPVGDPNVATFGSMGPAPDRFRLRRAHDRAAREIDRVLRAALHAARHAPRQRPRVVAGYRGARGTYHAAPGRRPRRKR
jgi:hypothetical protein